MSRYEEALAKKTKLIEQKRKKFHAMKSIKGLRAKPILGFPDYCIYENGVIRKRNTGAFMNQKMNKEGYHAINLTNGGMVSTLYIHRLVARSFIPDWPDDWTVDHIDRDKSHNHWSNLFPCTREHNIKLMHAAKGQGSLADDEDAMKHLEASRLKETDNADQD